MKISEILKGNKQFISLEVVPPQRSIGRAELLDSIRPLMEFNPPYINVTNHRDEYVFEQQPDGSFLRKLERRRVSQTAVCASMMDEFKIEVVAHLICAGATKEQVQYELSDFRYLGVENVMALRGDCLVQEKRFTPEPGGYSYACELVADIKDDGLCIGVGAYPEKHFEAPNIETDIAMLKRKVDAGADFIITQMFFDNACFYRFVELARKEGITVPIIPGIKPISTLRQIHLLPESFSINIPLELTRELEAHAQDKAAVYRIGQEWATMQTKDLLSHGVPAVHFYTMGKSDNIIGVLRECF